jgi:predicted acetyltransferase/protein associated with RNAse G/E
MDFQVGDIIHVSYYKANGVLHRSWETIVEDILEDCVVTISPAGGLVKDIKGDWATDSLFRSHYWLEKSYSLLEMYRLDGELEKIYVNISSPVKIEADRLSFTDYELDVVRRPPGPAFLADEEEFKKAIVVYGYSEDLVCSCYQAVKEAFELANGWVVKGMPVFGDEAFSVFQEKRPFDFYEPGQLTDEELELLLIEKDPGNPKINYVPAYHFKMVRMGEDLQIGSIDLRIGNTYNLVMFGGHIGYRVEPEYRGHHYAARACKLLLPLARRHGLKTLWITCNPDNIASRRTCELAGAELVEIIDLPEDNDMYQEGERQKCRYRLDL